MTDSVDLPDSSAPPAEGAPQTGWVRLGQDNVFRGWFSDRRNRDFRATVDVLVDGVKIGQAKADRFDPKLAEIGEGDGCYAFAVAAPRSVRDGFVHTVEAMAGDFPLKCGARTFSITAAASEPRLELLAVTPRYAHFRLAGGQYFKSVALELWIDGVRSPGAAECAPLKGAPEFTLNYDAASLASWAGRQVVAAAPGMIEAGLPGSPLWAAAGLRTEAQDGKLIVFTTGALNIPAGIDAALHIRPLGDGAAEPWVVAAAFHSGRQILELPPGLGAGMLELRLVCDGVDLPQFTTTALSPRVSDGRRKRKPIEPAAAGNLIRNPDLTRWPNGLVMSTTAERTETAEGWHVTNRGSTAPVRAVATSIPDDPDGRFALSLAADEVADGCRLEIALDGRALNGAKALLLSFEAGCGPAARRLRGAGFPDLPEFLLIDKIRLIQRATVVGEAGLELVEETLTVLAHQLPVSRVIERWELFALPKTKSSLDETRTVGPVEHLLSFNFRQPFAITLQRASLIVTAVPPRFTQPPPLSLEDRDITAQAGMVRGLEHWTTPHLLRAPRAGEAPAPAAEVGRWSWGAAGGASVEVVICVHNAADETLACLASLVGASRVLHTVRIIDDGSDVDTLRRIEAFIADKPWMRISRNPANLGYTASANRGVRESEADWVILLNSDTVVSAGWIEGMLECAASDPAIAFVGPLSNAASCQSVPELYDVASRWKTNPLPTDWTPERMARELRAASKKAFPQVPLLNGFCTLMRRAAFLELGGFNEKAFPQGYGEENDFCVRATKAGYKLAVADQVYVHHVKSASFGQARRAELAKAGDKALKTQHPETNFGALVAKFREIPALVSLRAAIAKLYDGARRGEDRS